VAALDRILRSPVIIGAAIGAAELADPTVNADGTSSWSSSTGRSAQVRKAEQAVGKNTCEAEYRAFPSQVLHPPPTQVAIADGPGNGT
jgi:hypothetical protein